MKNSAVMALCATAILALGACETYPTSKPPGQYTSTQKSTNSAGTTTSKTTKTNVYYDQEGDKKATQETETTRDPKGLFNKSTSTSTRTYN